MDDMNIEVKIRARVIDIQGALRRISGNLSYIISGEKGLYTAISSLLKRTLNGKIFPEWLAKSEDTKEAFEDRTVEIILRSHDPENAWRAARKLEQLVHS